MGSRAVGLPRRRRHRRRRCPRPKSAANRGTPVPCRAGRRALVEQPGQAAGSHVCSTDMGSSSADRSWCRCTTSSPGEISRACATAASAGTVSARRWRTDGVMPRRRISSVNEVNLTWRSTFGRATKVPLPCTRCRRPSTTSASTACRTVIEIRRTGRRDLAHWGPDRLVVVPAPPRFVGSRAPAGTSARIGVARASTRRPGRPLRPSENPARRA